MIVPRAPWCLYLRGLKLLHFVDNQGALANLIAGSAGAMDVAGVVAWYQCLTVSGQILPWFEYVESHLNLADVPSRLLDAFVTDPLAKALGISSVLPARLPPLEDLYLSTLNLLLLVSLFVADTRGSYRLSRDGS